MGSSPAKRRVCIVGLGNPGTQYKGSRHNIGFDWVDSALKARSSSAQFQERFQSEWALISEGSLELHFLKPQTYMNLSGKALAAWSAKFQGESETLVVLDDLDLPLGKLRLRFSGSDGGHRGLRSILESLQTDQIARLRIGVGRPSGEGSQQTRDETVNFVLERFHPNEWKILRPLIADAGVQLEAFLQNSKEIAMSRINGLFYGALSHEP